MLLPRILKTNNCKKFQLASQVYYSRKSSWKYFGSFKIRFPKPKEECQDVASLKLASDANWELFVPQGFRFYMPGNIGPGWHDAISTAFMPSTMAESDGTELDCIIQDCPILLRQGVTELFPGTDPSNRPMTIVTLSQRAKNESSDQDFEQLTKQFMWVAQEICNKLKMAGYWADFINPFSGLPYFSPFKNTKLYKTDERFRCLGFNIFQTGPCRVISNKFSQRFSGNLFTTAPASTKLLREVLRNYDCT